MKMLFATLMAMSFSLSALAGNVFIKQDKAADCELLFGIYKERQSDGSYKLEREPKAGEVEFINREARWIPQKEYIRSRYDAEKASFSYFLFENPNVDFDNREVELDVVLKVTGSINLKRRVRIKDDNKDFDNLIDKINRRVMNLASGVCINSAGVLIYAK